MNKLVTCVSVLIAFGAGFGFGFLATKKKYQTQSDKEIASVKDAFQKHIDELSKEGAIKDIPPTRRGNSKKKKTNKSENDAIRVAPLPNDSVMDNYRNYAEPYTASKSSKQSISKERQKKLEPYVISPDEYMSSEYEAKSLIYYSDGVLADEDDNVIPTPATLIGKNALTSFGQYEDDSVYVRDDNLKIDYEIMLSQKSFHKEYNNESSPKQSLQSDDDD